jgi:hypothetical protein
MITKHGIDERYTKYKEIRYYLMNKRIVDISDMWIRHERKHQLTPSGRLWEYADPKLDISTNLEILDIDIVDLRLRSEYIVALLHEHNQEIPIPLGK